MSQEENPNIVVEVTDLHEFHCFRLVLNPSSVPLGERPVSPCCNAPIAERYAGELICMACGQPSPDYKPRIEIMLHARSLVDLIHKCSLALSDWQHQTTDELLQRLGLGVKS